MHVRTTWPRLLLERPGVEPVTLSRESYALTICTRPHKTSASVWMLNYKSVKITIRLQITVKIVAVKLQLELMFTVY